MPSPLGKVAERSEVGRGKQNLSHRKRSPLPKGEGIIAKECSYGTKEERTGTE